MHAPTHRMTVPRRAVAQLLAVAVATALVVTIGAGNIVEYVYDAAGNITQVRRQSTAGLTIMSVSPVPSAASMPVRVRKMRPKQGAKSPAGANCARGIMCPAFAAGPASGCSVARGTSNAASR